MTILPKRRGDDENGSEYVTVAKCRELHGWTKAKMLLLIAVVLAMLAAPGIAITIAASVQKQASGNSIRIDNQAELLKAIHEDVREIRATQIQQIRNGQSHP